MTEDLGIIDNRNTEFGDKFKSFCKHTKELKIASGYFYVSGFDLVKDSIASIGSIKVVMGDETDIETAKELGKGHKEKIKNKLIDDLYKISDGSAAQLDALKELRDYIAKGKIDVKIYIKEKFHAKAYIFERKDESIGDIAIVGSSNFSRAGIQGNTELNSIHKNDSDLYELKRWFNEIWDEAEPFREELLKIIESHPTYIRNILGEKGYVSPFDLFKVMAYEYLYHDIAIFKNVLTEFQKIGVINAKKKINTYNGCIIADSVGLGKTFIGAGLIQDFQKEDKGVLLIVPASVKENWERELFRKDKHGNKFFDISEKQLKIITITELSRIDLREKKDKQKLNELKNNYDVIAIDEAHRFRNHGFFDEQKSIYSGNKNYANLMELRDVDKKYVLLTATPLNNSIRDLSNLINTFTNTTILKNNGLEFSHFDSYENLLKQIKKLEKESGSSLEKIHELKKKLGEHAEGIIKILEEIMILRTRSEISRRYPELEIQGQKITFKTAQIKPQKYSFPDTYIPIYENLSDFLVNLNVPHIALINETSGTILAGLYRVLLFKRLESSVYSFTQSIERLKRKEEAFRDEIKQIGWEKLKEKRKRDVEYNRRSIEGDLELTEWIEDHEIGQASTKFQNVSEKEVLKLVEKDLEQIEKFTSRFMPLIKREGKYAYDDTKLTKLKELLANLTTKKVLIFTQYIDTVDYLYHNLKEWTKKQKLVLDCQIGENIGEVEIGTTISRDKKIKLFAPRSNEYTLNENENEIDILITTDALSEGVNLQDCHHVINYDLPWNPMRIVQRVGRVDRIGSTERVIVYNIYPDEELENLLELLEKLKTKIKNIAHIIGKENYILSEDEDINPRIIGEKIKELREASDFATYEEIGRNGLFKNLKTTEERSAKILELKAIVGSLNLKAADFKEYEMPVYAVMTNEHRKGLFAMYRIYDKNKVKELLGGKIDDILLFYDLKTGKYQEIDIKELDLMNIETSIKKNDPRATKFNLDEKLKELKDYFLKVIFENRRKAFRQTEMRQKIKPSKLQRYVTRRLREITITNKLSVELSEEILKRARHLLKQFNEKIFDTKVSEYLKTAYIGTNVGRKDYETAIRAVNKLSNEQLIYVTEKFYKDYIKDNPNYVEKLRTEGDIQHKLICWGAFI